MFSAGKKTSFVILIFLVYFTLVVPAWSDEVGEKVRSISEISQGALVNVRIVLEVRKSEMTVERLATVVDPSGLMVMSLASIDPSMLGILPSSVDIQVKDMTVIMTDKEELPVRIVLRDTDLDLALLRPVEDLEKAMDYVSIDAEPKPEMMDQIVMLSKLGSAANYTPIAVPARIVGVITKPRTSYVMSLSPDMSDLGSPVFNMDGTVVGFILLKVDITGQTSPVEMMMSGGPLNILPVVLPVKEVANVISKME
jgi:hypothetical protein